jgi:hypothetical protein
MPDVDRHDPQDAADARIDGLRVAFRTYVHDRLALDPVVLNFET